MSKKNNISKFNQIDNTILLEYIINNFLADKNDEDFFDKDIFTLNENQLNVINWNIKTSNNDTGLICVDNNYQYTNNGYNHICVPIDNEGIEFFEPYSKENLISFYKQNNNLDLEIKDFYSNNVISYDTIKLHILSGYSFEDVYGFLLKVTTLNNDKEIIHLSNWLYKNSDLSYHFEKPIILNNKIFDKFIEIKIPSIQYLKSQKLGDDELANYINHLNINGEETSFLPNINISYSIIKNKDVDYVYEDNLSYNKEIGKKFHLENEINLSIPYNSLSDNFNLYMSESTNGNYIDFYTTWCDNPLTSSIVSMFNTRYQLYEAQKNIYKDSIYNIDENKNQWVVIHEIVTSFFNNDGKKIMPDETYTLTQEFNYESNEKKIFHYKPFIINDIHSNNLSYITFNYTAKLINRMDGVQIVRYGSLTSEKVSKYIEGYKLNTNNLINYSIYNKIIKNEQKKVANVNTTLKNKYIKVFYDANDIYIDNNYSDTINEEIILKRNTHTYKFSLKRKNENGDIVFLDLNDMSSYLLVFSDSNGKNIEIQATYSSNMNLSLGELEFTLTKNIIDKLLNSKYNYFNIMIVNSNGSRSTIYEGKYKFQH